MDRPASAEHIPIIDAHHHVWDLDRNYHPWLCDEPPIAFRYGDYRALRRNYLPEDYRRDSSSFNVVASVYVEAEWDPDDPVGESRWIDTDNELIPPGTAGHNPAYLQQLSDFVRGADALVTDTTYRDADYPAKVGWGHSSVSQVADLAHRAEVKSLYLFHHDPAQTDDDIDAKLTEVREALSELGSATECFAPAEGSTLQL